MHSFVIKCTAILLFIYLGFVESVTKPINFKNGGYESITITINENVPEDPVLIDNLKVSYFMFYAKLFMNFNF